LADRQQILVGKHLSPVQWAAIELMLVLEAKEKAEAFTDDFRLAAVSADPARFVPLMFPEWMNKDEEVRTSEDAEAIIEGTSGSFKFTEQITPEEAERALAEMLANPVGTLSADDIDTWE
jgi:hypothetical protein